MKKKTIILSYGIIAVAVCVATVIIGVSQKSNLTDNEDTSNVYAVSKHENNLQSSPVRTIEGTDKSMLSADYWIKENDERELFSKEEIAFFNKNNKPYLQYYNEEKGRNSKLYTDDLPGIMEKEVVEALIDADSIAEREEDESKLYINGEPAEKGYIATLISNMALDDVPEEVTLRYAICVDRTVAKIVPSTDFASSDPDDVYFDDFISAEVMPFSGVVVLHESADHQYFYVINGTYCGWVKKETLALCNDKDEWIYASCPDNFLLVTGCEIVLDETARETYSSGKILPMGTKMRLSLDPPETVNDRSLIGCYCVDLPYRNDSGFLSWEQSLVPMSDDVHVGYLDMTSKSVITQAFKFLGKVYGYGGALSSNDCSGFLRQVYECYGFELPRNARAIAERPDLGSINCEKMTPDKKKELLGNMPAGLPLFMEGHIMLYLGMEDEVPYVISSCATCIEPGHEPDDIVDVYSVFVSSLELVRKSGATWLEDLSYILWKEY